MNKQREVIYAQRRDALESAEIDALVQEMHYEVLDDLFDAHIPVDAYADDWDLTGLTEALHQQYGVSVPLSSEHVASFSREALLDHVRMVLDQAYAVKGQTVGHEQFQGLERWVTLQVIDKHWKDHLLAMDHLKEGIGLRGYGQKNPLNEYKREGYELFLDMTDRIKADITEYLFKAQVTNSAEAPITPQPRRQQRAVAHRGNLPGMQGERDGGTVTTVRRQGEKVGRNAPCPCGSGKKYKKCCGAV
jgi:preprotein translocase subunit SecA